MEEDRIISDAEKKRKELILKKNRKVNLRAIDIEYGCDPDRLEEPKKNSLFPSSSLELFSPPVPLRSHRYHRAKKIGIALLLIGIIVAPIIFTKANTAVNSYLDTAGLNFNVERININY